MLSRSEIKRFIVFLTIISVLMIPAFVAAGGHGGGGCCGSQSIYSSYPYYATGRLGSGLFGLSSGYSYYPNTLGAYSYGYPLAQSYGAGYGYPMSLGSLYGLGGYGLGGYGLGYPQSQAVVTGKDYTVGQTQTVYVPGGEISTNVSETTKVSIIPQWPYLYSNPYSNFGNYGLGGNYLLSGLGSAWF